MTIPKLTGFLPASQLRKKRRMLIGTEGLADTGKTEFALSVPGPGKGILLDRGIDGVLDNLTPPPARRLEDWVFKIIPIPSATQSNKPEFYQEYWMAFLKEYIECMTDPCHAVLIDGDSDSWELQRLAEHGKLTGVWPQTKFGPVYAARKAMINRAWDAGKIVISTNKLKNEWKKLKDANGNDLLDDNGDVKKEPTGDYERQGFPDQAYLYMIQLRHLYRRRLNIKTKQEVGEFGLRILKCKANMELVGSELWGDDCNFAGLMTLCYPQVDLSEWGF